MATVPTFAELCLLSYTQAPSAPIPLLAVHASRLCPPASPSVSPGAAFLLSLGEKRTNPAAIAAPPLKRHRSHTYLYPNPVQLWLDKMAPHDTLAPLIQRMRDDVVSLRDSGAALVSSGLSAAVSQLSPAQYSPAITAAQSRSTLSAHRLSVFSMYRAYMEAHGLPPTLPLTPELVNGYIGWKVLVRKDKSHAADGTISNLRVAAKSMGAWNVDAAGEESITAHLAFLRKLAPSKHEESTLVPTDIILASCNRLKASGTLLALQLRALISVCALLSMRFTELTDPRALRWGEHTVTPQGVIFEFYLSKTRQELLDPEIRAAPHLSRELQGICLSACLADYQSSFTAAGDPTLPDSFLFPFIDPISGFISASPLSADEASLLVYEQFALSGMDTSSVDAHWGRHAGNHIYCTSLGMSVSVAAPLSNFSTPSTEAKDIRTSKQHKYYTHTVGEDRLNTAALHIKSLWTHTCCGPADR